MLRTIAGLLVARRRFVDDLAAFREGVGGPRRTAEPFCCLVIDDFCIVSCIVLLPILTQNAASFP